jgi:hypothetical protein
VTLLDPTPQERPEEGPDPGSAPERAPLVAPAFPEVEAAAPVETVRVGAETGPVVGPAAVPRTRFGRLRFARPGFGRRHAPVVLGEEDVRDRPHRGSAVRRFVTQVVAIAVGGIAVGYVASAFVSGFVAGGSLTGRPAEPVETRAYIDALIHRDVGRLAQLQPPSDIGTQAGALQQAATGQTWKPQGLSYLGGQTIGPMGVYVYVLKVQSADGSQEQTVPFAFTLLDKKIVRVQ